MVKLPKNHAKEEIKKSKTSLDAHLQTSLNKKIIKTDTKFKARLRS